MVGLFKFLNITPVLALVDASLIKFHPSFKKFDIMVNCIPHNFSGDKLG